MIQAILELPIYGGQGEYERDDKILDRVQSQTNVAIERLDRPHLLRYVNAIMNNYLRG